MKYELEDGENPRFNEDFKRDKPEMELAEQNYR